MITVQLLGGATLRSGDAPLGGPPAQRHRIALLTLIVSAWPQPVSRDRAMALLWPEICSTFKAKKTSREAKGRFTRKESWFPSCMLPLSAMRMKLFYFDISTSAIPLKP